MPTVASIMSELKKKGKESTRKIYARHGYGHREHVWRERRGPQDDRKNDQKAAGASLRTYATGNLDAMLTSPGWWLTAPR